MNDLDMLQWLLSLVVVIAFILLFAWLAQKSRVFGSNHAHLKVVASLPLGPKERLMVVQVGDEQLVIGVTGQQINLLQTLNQPLPVSGNELNPFANKLALMMKQQTERRNEK